MLGMGLTLETEDFKRVLKRPLDVTIGVCCQYLIMPLAGFLLATVFNLPSELATGVVLLGCCPGGTASNVISFLSRADVALSVTLTMVSTLLSPLLIPTLMEFYANRWIDVPAAGLFLTSLKVVLLPVVSGVFVGKILGDRKNKILPILPGISCVVIIFIIAVIVALNANSLALVGPFLMFVVIIHNLFGFTVGYVAGILSGMDKKRAKTISIEVGMQNSGLGVALATANLNPASAIPSAIFSIWHNISGSVVAYLWSRNQKDTGENSCKR